MTARDDPGRALRGAGRAAWLEFADDLAGRHLSPRTAESYGAAAGQLQLWLDEHEDGTDILQATAPMIRRFLAHVGSRSARGASTAANRYRGLVQAYKFWAAEEIIVTSPMARVKCPAHEYQVPEVVPDEQLSQLLRVTALDRTFAGRRDSAMLRLLCEPGSPRASELAGLAVASISMEAKTVAIDGKGGVHRVIMMSPLTAKAMYRYLRARALRADAGSTALFLGLRGPVTRSGVGQMLDQRCRLAGVPRMHPHQLRHTSFADFNQANGNANYAMALYGWKSPAMVHHYGRAARAMQARQAAAGMARADRLG